MVAADILVIRILIFLTADFGCATKKISGIQLLDFEHVHTQQTKDVCCKEQNVVG